MVKKGHSGIIPIREEYAPAIFQLMTNLSLILETYRTEDERRNLIEELFDFLGERLMTALATLSKEDREAIFAENKQIREAWDEFTKTPSVNKMLV